MDLVEGVGESSSPARSFGGFGCYDIRNDVYNRLLESGNDEAVCNPELREQLDAHFNRLPASYALDINMDRAEDVLLHQKLLSRARDPENRPVFHIRFLEAVSAKLLVAISPYGSKVENKVNVPMEWEAFDVPVDILFLAQNVHEFCQMFENAGICYFMVKNLVTQWVKNFWPKGDDIEDQPVSSVLSDSKLNNSTDNEGIQPANDRNFVNDFEPCSKLEDLNLDVRNSNDLERGTSAEDFTRRQEVSNVPIHEVIFSTVDKPKLLSQLSALLSDIGLNIREAHVFSTTDGYSLDVFVVDGWPIEDTEGLNEAMRIAIARNEGSWSGSSHSRSAVEKALAVEAKSGDWELDRKLIKIGEKIASGSCGDLYRGVYIGQDVAVKVLRSEHLNDTLEDEFAQEVAILRQLQHRNVVRFIGACTKSPHLCIVTEYMPGGSLYEYLHRNHSFLKLSQLLKFAIDVCKGMEYLHQKNIIHRDLKTANLLMDSGNVVKVADFGVARFQSVGGVMTAETGTYRWMAPEVINHQPYDQKADVFSFAIVLWELVTAKVPYETMTPLQAALGVRQGLRPELPKNAHPKLLDLMQRCWEAVPAIRPSFSEIRVELEELFREVQETAEERNGS